MSLVNFRKWARAVGKPSYPPGPMPPIQLMLDASTIARFNPQGAIAAGSNQTVQSFFGCLAIDPPVGGFASGDLLAQCPGEVSSPMSPIAAVITPDNTRNFAPGTYEIGFAVAAGVANVGIALFIRDQEGRPLAGFAPPCIGWLRRTISEAPFFQCSKIYADKLWHIDVVAVGALADASVVTAAIQVSPIHLFDDYSG